MFTIDRKTVTYKDLCDIMDAAGGYPVFGNDIDGTMLCVSWVEPNEGDPFCTLWEPGDERGSKKTCYFDNGSTEVIYVKNN